MTDRYWQRARRRDRLVGFGWTALVGGSAIAGWFIGGYWQEAPLGLFAGLSVACLLSLLIIDDEIRATTGGTFALGVPVIYVLVVVTEVPLVAAGLVPFSIHRMFLTPLIGAVVGTAVVVLSALKGAAKLIADRPRAPSGGPRDFTATILWGLSVRAGTAFLIASGFVVFPIDRGPAVMVLGVSWGIVAGCSQAVFTVLLDRQPVRTGWSRIVVIEFMLALLLIGVAIAALKDHAHRWLLQLPVAAAITCAVTFAVVDFGARVFARLRS
jgi:hypothetical protein